MQSRKHIRKNFLYAILNFEKDNYARAFAQFLKNYQKHDVPKTNFTDVYIASIKMTANWLEITRKLKYEYERVKRENPFLFPTKMAQSVELMKISLWSIEYRDSWLSMEFGVTVNFWAITSLFGELLKSLDELYGVAFEYKDVWDIIYNLDELLTSDLGSIEKQGFSLKVSSDGFNIHTDIPKDIPPERFFTPDAAFIKRVAQKLANPAVIDHINTLIYTKLGGFEVKKMFFQNYASALNGIGELIAENVYYLLTDLVRKSAKQFKKVVR